MSDAMLILFPQPAIGTGVIGSKGRDTSESDEDYDTPLVKRFCKHIQEKSVVSPPTDMEADSVKECLQGNSVVDPLVPEQIYDSALLAPEADACKQPVLAQDAPAAYP